MNRELEQKLVDRFPKFFKDYRGDPRKTCMAFGLEHADGWYGIIERLCLAVEKELQPGEEFWFLQIKEKFATLRVYFSGPERVRPLINAAEVESSGVCEDCGSAENVLMTSVTMWYKTRCQKCWDEDADRRGKPRFAADRLAAIRAAKEQQDE